MNAPKNKKNSASRKCPNAEATNNITEILDGRTCRAVAAAVSEQGGGGDSGGDSGGGGGDSGGGGSNSGGRGRGGQGDDVPQTSSSTPRMRFVSYRAIQSKGEGLGYLDCIHHPGFLSERIVRTWLALQHCDPKRDALCYEVSNSST